MIKGRGNINIINHFCWKKLYDFVFVCFFTLVFPPAKLFFLLLKSGVFFLFFIFFLPFIGPLKLFFKERVWAGKISVWHDLSWLVSTRKEKNVVLEVHMSSSRATCQSCGGRGIFFTSRSVSCLDGSTRSICSELWSVKKDFLPVRQ